MRGSALPCVLFSLLSLPTVLGQSPPIPEPQTEFECGQYTQTTYPRLSILISDAEAASHGTTADDLLLAMHLIRQAALEGVVCDDHCDFQPPTCMPDSHLAFDWAIQQVVVTVPGYSTTFVNATVSQGCTPCF
ncbi:MAG TPA: hypothetical protein VJP77_05415 [Planctomycetota bacterium]|nr:hypothetical protein [Planctomycetota bacterium]